MNIVMHWPVALVAGLAWAALIATPASAQMDMAVMQKWMTVSVVRYVVVGEYAADTMVMNAGTNGYAPVKDRVEMTFDWDQTEAKLVGVPVIKNFPSELGAIRNGAKGCRAPTLTGAYEHMSVLSLTPGLGGQLKMEARRDYPAASSPVACTGGSQAVAAKSVTETQDFVVPGVMILAGPAAASGSVKVSADRKSIISTDKGWTWTYTPTPVK